MKKLILTLTLTAITVIGSFLFSCTTDAGSKFLGHWIDVETKTHDMYIEKNGNNFTLKSNGENDLTGNMDGGNLVVMANGAKLEFSYQESNGHIISSANGHTIEFEKQ